MGPAIGPSPPIAIGVMVSPLPMVAVVLMLLSNNAKANAFAFVLTWLVAIALLTGVVAFLADASTGADETPPVWVSTVKIVLGAPASAQREEMARPTGRRQEPPAP
ncbi:MAG: GAP family protein [Umezawaea sp.]